MTLHSAITVLSAEFGNTIKAQFIYWQKLFLFMDNQRYEHYYDT